MNKWMELADQVLEGKEVKNEEALSILECPDDDVLLLMHGAFQIRKRYYGKKVKLNMIMNAKSGLCPEIAATALNLLFLQHRLIHIEW
jgi:biotin synthase